MILCVIGQVKFYQVLIGNPYFRSLLLEMVDRRFVYTDGGLLPQLSP